MLWLQSSCGRLAVTLPNIGTGGEKARSGRACDVSKGSMLFHMLLQRSPRPGKKHHWQGQPVTQHRSNGLAVFFWQLCAQKYLLFLEGSFCCPLFPSEDSSCCFLYTLPSEDSKVILECLCHHYYLTSPLQQLP